MTTYPAQHSRTQLPPRPPFTLSMLCSECSVKEHVASAWRAEAQQGSSWWVLPGPTSCGAQPVGLLLLRPPTHIAPLLVQQVQLCAQADDEGPDVYAALRAAVVVSGPPKVTVQRKLRHACSKTSCQSELDDALRQATMSFQRSEPAAWSVVQVLLLPQQHPAMTVYSLN